MVGRNERADDSRFKSGLQNLLGGLVLLALPSLASIGFTGWNNISTIVNEQRHLVETVDAINKRVGLLEEWRIGTERDRFRWSDGEALRQAVASVAQELYSVKESIIAHNSRAEKYIEKIERMEKDSHKHVYKPGQSK